MATDDRLITDFNVIESEKENILPLRDGRSAHALSQTLQQKNEDPSGNKFSETRLAFEQQIMDELEEMDDPLELYLEYLAWINNAYPQGGQSKQSGMLEVMERCLMYFKDIDTYKNDPRYLKIWLWYIELFTPTTAERRDLFVYLMRKEIGTKLALYYEEFAGVFFSKQDYGSARQVLLRGIENNARPVSRLRKTLGEFEQKLYSMEIDPHTLGAEEDVFDQSLGPVNILGRSKPQIRSQLGTQFQSSSKHAIFQDSQGDDKEKLDLDLKKFGWDHLDSKFRRNKENQLSVTALEPGTNVGELKQHDIGRRDIDKLPVFKDSIGRSGPIYKMLDIPGRKPEKIDCNFKLIYPTENEEFCLEEIMAIARNVYYKKKEPYFEENRVIQRDLHKKRKLALKEKVHTPVYPKASQQSQLITDPIDSQEYRKVTTTSILPLKDGSNEEHTSQSVTKRNPPNSPTVTFFSKDAMSEVYSMFNQHYSEPKPLLEKDDTTSKFALFENFTQEFTRKTMDDLTEVKPSQSESLHKTPHKENESQDVNEFSKETTTPSYKSKLQDYMTPIQERTETTFKYAASQEDDNRSRKSDIIGSVNTAESSPFLTQPQLLPPAAHENTERNIITDPLNVTFRNGILESLQPPLTAYETFYLYNQPLKMSSLLKKIHKASKNVNKNPIVDFKKTNDLYCIRTELGEGGYATVYLAESSTGSLKALKVEKPASVWEFYILKQMEKRLQGERILKSIINVSSLHCFEDESYLVLNYASQGTVLDLINLEKERSGSSLDELLCMFITVEIMKVLECVHDVGIVHGDLKPDNCMIRFEESSTSLGYYDHNGKNGWSSKGIYLIDFGRSFDLTLFPLGTKFKANWRTDQQDCPEMRENKPWSYEADYYGLAGIVHAMLFGKFIDTVRLPNGNYKLSNSLKRYWKQELWSPLFETLLNSGEHDSLPITPQIRKLREQFEGYLETEGSLKLRSLIINVEQELLRFKK